MGSAAPAWNTGPAPHPRRVPPNELREAQGVQRRARGRVVVVDPHVVCGDAQRLAARLTTLQRARRSIPALSTESIGRCVNTLVA